MRVLSGERDRETISGTLVSGAPTFQESSLIVGSDRQAIGALLSVRNLLEHERLQRGDPRLRSMLERVYEQALEDRLSGAEQLGRLTEHDGIVIIDVQGRIRYVNSIAENQYRRVGYPDSLVGEQISVLDTSEYVCLRAMERGTCLEQRIREGDQVWIKRVLPLLPPPWRALRSPLHRRGASPEGAAIYIQDITEEVHREQEIKTKSAMIQEVHHRVKNNLQTLALLLRMQAKRSAPEIRDMLLQTIGRVLSIAVVHEFLSRGDDSDIDIRAVCGRIAEEASAELSDPSKQLEIRVEGGRFYLAAQQATSCALAVNELLHNAVEHGFAERERGRVEISLFETDGSIVIRIADDGAGFSAGFDPDVSNSLGLSIVRTLVRDDLRGQLQFSNQQGVTAEISFPKDLCRSPA
jgi:two-component sensor histidine kinase